jgi:hypothetical protein
LRTDFLHCKRVFYKTFENNEVYLFLNAAKRPSALQKL